LYIEGIFFLEILAASIFIATGVRSVIVSTSWKVHGRWCGAIHR
jgi:hypothetical protein